ncbi:MAG: glycoside hydrolase family 127 protein [Kiritimatiellae bacterium]|nr:glycoside hydrolase family 127 protein [Kiritimatiellia bacterium]
MNRFLVWSVVAVAFAGTGIAAESSTVAKYDDVKIMGYVGSRLDSCIRNHVVAEDPNYFALVFQNKNETGAWQTEFWGKYMHAAAPFATYTGCPLLKQKIAESTKRVIATQLPDGYIGNYREGNRCGGGWDVWGMKYTLLGLIHQYDETGDAEAIAAARKLADYLLSVFGPGKKDLYKTGNYRGMPSCSVLEPIVWLYNRTKDKKYLDFASYIVSQLNDTKDGARLIDLALEGVAVGDRPKEGDVWWGWLNGRKAYEMMSCYQGLLEYYEATGDKRCLDAAVATAKSIVETEVNITGGAAAHECWYHGKARQVQPFSKTMETCVLTTWLRFCEKLLSVTGDLKYADEIEKTFYNSFLATLNRDGSIFSQYLLLSGFRSPGEDHCKMLTNCCNANGPRGFLVFVRSLLMANGDTAILNLYSSSRASVTLPKLNEKVTFETYTLYPKEGAVTIWNRTEKPLEFTLKLRIPAWAPSASAKVNGQPVKDVKPGTYLAIKRTWTPGDVIELSFEMVCRAQVQNHFVAFTRGPIVLARDMRFHDGDIGEAIRSFPVDKPLEARSVRTDNPDIWQAYTLALPTGLHSENPENRKPQIVHFCDFASAGNTWDDTSSYRVWFPLELDPSHVSYNE